MYCISTNKPMIDIIACSKELNVAIDINANTVLVFQTTLNFTGCLILRERSIPSTAIVYTDTCKKNILINKNTLTAEQRFLKRKPVYKF